MDFDNRKLLEKNRKNFSADIAELAEHFNLDFFNKKHEKTSMAWWKKVILVTGLCALTSVICYAFVDSSIYHTQFDIQYSLFDPEYAQTEQNDKTISQLASVLTPQTISALSQSDQNIAYQLAHENVIHQIDAFFIKVNDSNNNQLSLKQRIALLPTEGDLIFMSNLVLQKSLPKDIQVYFAQQLQNIIAVKSHLYFQMAQEKLNARNSYDVSHFRSDSHYLANFAHSLNHEYGFLWFLSQQALHDSNTNYYDNLVAFRHLSYEEKQHQLPEDIWKK
jgi:hypothetical protein